MLTVLTICLPFFALIFLGTWLRFSKFITESFSKELSKFAFYIAMPPYIMFTIAKTDISSFFDIKFLLSYEIITVLVFCFSALISKYFNARHKTNWLFWIKLFLSKLWLYRYLFQS